MRPGRVGPGYGLLYNPLSVEENSGRFQAGRTDPARGPTFGPLRDLVNALILRNINRLRQFERCPARLHCLAVRNVSAKLATMEFDAGHAAIDPSSRLQLYNNSLAFDRRKGLADAHDRDIRLVRRTDVNHHYMVLAGLDEFAQLGFQFGVTAA